MFWDRATSQSEKQLREAADARYKQFIAVGYQERFGEKNDTTVSLLKTIKDETGKELFCIHVMVFDNSDVLKYRSYRQRNGSELKIGLSSRVVFTNISNLEPFFMVQMSNESEVSVPEIEEFYLNVYQKLSKSNQSA